MIIDKETGNIIFDTGEVLKPRMTLDEVKASSIISLLRDENINDIEHSLWFKPFTCYGSTVYMKAVMSSKRIGKVTICLDEAANFYEDPYYDRKFPLYEEKHINFIKKILQIDEFDGDIHFKWGCVDFSANARSAYMKIGIKYYLEDEDTEDL